jgi:SHS2 domain-containing protein
MPFEEIQHTADVSLRIWASDLPTLFSEAARGMNTLAGVNPTQGIRTSRYFEAEAADRESLLVAFLSELIFRAEQEHLIFNKFKVDITGFKLQVWMSGSPILSVGRLIKAVTYHNMQIHQTENGYEVNIVFDV